MNDTAQSHARELTRYTVNDLSHPAVALRQVGRFVVVAYGSSKHRPHMESLQVDHRTRDGKNLHLTAPTYFYGGNCVPAPQSDLPWTGRRCPIALFLRLEEFYIPQLAKIEARLALPADPAEAQSSRS